MRDKQRGRLIIDLLCESESGRAVVAVSQIERSYLERQAGGECRDMG